MKTFNAVLIKKLPKRFHRDDYLSVLYGYSVWVKDILQEIKEGKEEVKRFKRMHTVGVVSKDALDSVKDCLRFNESLLKYFQDNKIDVAFEDLEDKQD